MSHIVHEQSCLPPCPGQCGGQPGFQEQPSAGLHVRSDVGECFSSAVPGWRGGGSHSTVSDGLGGLPGQVRGGDSLTGRVTQQWMTSEGLQVGPGSAPPDHLLTRLVCCWLWAGVGTHGERVQPLSSRAWSDFLWRPLPATPPMTDTCTHLYTHVHTQTHRHICAQVHTHIGTHVHTYTCVLIDPRAQKTPPHTHIQASRTPRWE